MHCAGNHRRLPLSKRLVMYCNGDLQRLCLRLRRFWCRSKVWQLAGCSGKMAGVRLPMSLKPSHGRGRWASSQTPGPPSPGAQLACGMGAGGIPADPTRSREALIEISLYANSLFAVNYLLYRPFTRARLGRGVAVPARRRQQSSGILFKDARPTLGGRTTEQHAADGNCTT